MCHKYGNLVKFQSESDTESDRHREKEKESESLFRETF